MVADPNTRRQALLKTGRVTGKAALDAPAPQSRLIEIGATQFIDARASAAWRALMTSTRRVCRRIFEISRRLPL